MSFITAYQLPLLISCFLTGCVGTALLFRHPAGDYVWKLADLVWVLLGGIGALVAIIAGLYAADNSRLNRQIDIAYASTTAFDRDAARFRLRFCDPPHDADIAILCEKIEFLSASTASNADLPLFISLTEASAPLTGLHLPFGRRGETMDGMADMADEATAFDVDPFLAFTSVDDTTQAAIDTLRRKIPTIAGDYLILAQSYDALIEQVSTLKDEWDYLQANAHILVLQIMALCLVSFAAPFRLGKSIVELRD